MRPSSYCGVYGYKPSFGIIPRTGILKTLDTLDHVGFFSRSIEDLMLLLDVTRVRGKNHPFVYKLKDSRPQTRQAKWRVAFVKTPVWGQAASYTQKALEEFASSLARVDGMEVNEVELPEEFSTVHASHNQIYEKALSYYFNEEYETKPEWISPVFKAMVERGRAISLEDYKKGLRTQVEFIQKLDHFFEDYDILLSHTTAGEAPSLHSPNEPPDPCLMWTFCHVPAVHIPCFTGPSGLPFGVQFVAKRYHDYTLLDFLSQMERKGVSLNATVNTHA